MKLNFAGEEILAKDAQTAIQKIRKYGTVIIYDINEKRLYNVAREVAQKIKFINEIIEDVDKQTIIANTEIFPLIDGCLHVYAMEILATTYVKAKRTIPIGAQWDTDVLSDHKFSKSQHVNVKRPIHIPAMSKSN
jgi:hypothetical protein